MLLHSPPLREIEQQNLRSLLSLQRQRRFTKNYDTIALFGVFPINADRATCDLDPRMTRLVHNMVNRFVCIQYRRKQTHILMHRHGSVATILSRNQAQLPTSVILGKRLLLVTRLKVDRVRQDPDLQQVHALGIRRILLAVSHTSARTHPLHVAGTNDRTIAHAVFVFERTFEDVRNDLHVAMAMLRKPSTRSHKILIDHTQAAKAHVTRIVILIERERVEGVEPPVIEMPALF